MKELKREAGFVLSRHDTLQTIVCSDCKKEKTSKLNAQSISDIMHVICNGCFGLRVSKEKP
jgi:hypothetical protein